MQNIKDVTAAFRLNPIQALIRRIRITVAQKLVLRAIVKRNPKALTQLSRGGIGLLSARCDGMPTGRTVDFPPMGVAGIVAWIDDKLKDGPERVFPAISDRWKDDELPSTPETIEAANLDRIVALGFFEGDRLLVEPTIDSGVVMTFNDETGEQVFLTVKIISLNCLFARYSLRLLKEGSTCFSTIFVLFPSSGEFFAIVCIFSGE